MRNFDLILLDINMPRISGFETLKEIRRIQPNLPVIVLSARQEKSDVIEGFRVGADDYISKPFDLEDINLPLFPLTSIFTKPAAISPSPFFFTPSLNNNEINSPMPRP